MSDSQDQTVHERAGLRLLRPVVLIGLMGAGKSSVGRRLAAQIGAPFADSDVEIEAAAGMTIPEIFEQYGETYFRDGERRVIARMMEGDAGILATGGGAFMDPRTRDVIAERGVSVWLRADLDVLVSRTVGRKNRPLLNRGNPRDILASLMDERYPVYGLADVVVDSLAGQTHEAMSARIIAALRAYEGGPVLEEV